MKNIPYELIARYLAGECNDDEKQQIREWSEQHPGVMDEFSKIWQQIPADDFTPDVEQALQKVNLRIGGAKKKSLPLRFFSLIGSVAAVAAIVIILINIISTPGQDASNNYIAENLSTLNTGDDEMLEYKLSDGSTVWLNRSSSLRYPESFSGNTREIYLEGEAFFEIAPDAHKPFIIHANNTQTKVVGTSFGIKAAKDAGEVVVTVSTGVINFSAEGKSGHIELKKGEQGICDTKQRKLEKNNNPDPNSLAWKTKILVFQQSPLSEVAKVIENTYRIPVSVDGSIANLQITSTFDRLSLEEIMQIIELTLQIRAEDSAGGILLTSQ
ncbi:FecR family protein [Dysgonomonas sp. 511]|uniref:FecR family protein n=1 Tax=Dysgonomonas sp. 511 TaxID=2302930 RepID=UPI0013D8327A|nr:FecR domain-containing protein [Dysgonomonas sp. 511]NDV79288.1 DUF4974 domain-containing protein [Dysgonomonas sp. 511]